jgi:hypothetical protein
VSIRNDQMILHKRNVVETLIVRFYCSPEVQVYLFLVSAVTCSLAEFAYNLRGCMLIDFTLILHNIQNFCVSRPKASCFVMQKKIVEIYVCMSAM